MADLNARLEDAMRDLEKLGAPVAAPLENMQ